MNDYGDDKEGYSNNLDAQIAFLSDAFKRSSSKQERRALFNQAFGLARKAGMQQFDWATGPIAVKLAEHAQVATHVANAEHERAEKLQVALDKSQAKVTNIPKMVYDQLNIQEMPSGIGVQTFTPEALEKIREMNNFNLVSPLEKFLH